MNNRQTLNLFVEAGLVDQGSVDDILQEINTTGKSLPDTLIDYQVCDEDGFYRVIADAIGAEYVNLKDFEAPPEIARLMPGKLAQLHRGFPLGFDDHVLQVALCDPLNPQTMEDLRFALGKDVQ